MTHDKGLRALVRKWRAPDGHNKENDYGHSFGCCAYELLDELEALLAAPAEPPAGLTEEQVLAVLKEHWLFAIHCNHKSETDVATCACGWNSPEHSSVGLAVEKWAEHALFYITRALRTKAGSSTQPTESQRETK